MTRLLRGVALCILGVFCSLSFSTEVHSQDIFSQLDQLRDQLNTLQQEVSNLKAVVYTLEKQAPKPATTPSPPLTERKPQKRLGTLEKKEAKSLACKAGEKFLVAVDAALALNNEPEAERRMDRAMADLRAALHPYEEDKEVAKFLSLAEALAWDTYTAVGLRTSVEGDSEFLRYIAQSKRRFAIFCGTK